MAGGMPDGALDSSQHGEATSPDWAPRARVRTDSRSGSRRRQDADRSNQFCKRAIKRKNVRAEVKGALLRGMYDAAKHGLDQESWVGGMMNKKLPYKKGVFVPRSLLECRRELAGVQLQTDYTRPSESMSLDTAAKEEEFFRDAPSLKSLRYHLRQHSGLSASLLHAPIENMQTRDPASACSSAPGPLAFLRPCGMNNLSKI
jgi:hypothetical protein